MIVFDLECRAGAHRFEGWFGSSEDFASQQARGLVSCPQCGSADVIKAPMAPNLSRKGNQRAEGPSRDAVPSAAANPAVPSPSPVSQSQAPISQPAPPSPPSPQVMAMMHAIATAQAEALKSSRWVGGKFVENARAMHYGDKEPAPIHGQATPDEARALIEEGVEVAPILFPVAPPSDVN